MISVTGGLLLRLQLLDKSFVFVRNFIDDLNVNFYVFRRCFFIALSELYLVIVEENEAVLKMNDKKSFM